MKALCVCSGERERERVRESERQREVGYFTYNVLIVLCLSRWLGCVLVSHGLDVALSL